MKKRVLAFMLSFLMIFTMFPWSVYAAPVNMDVGNGILVSSIGLAKAIDDKNEQSMFVEIKGVLGDDPSKLNVKFRNKKGEPVNLIRDATLSNSSYAYYAFPKDQIGEFTGSIIVNNVEFNDLLFNGLPTVTNVTPRNVVIKDGVTDYPVTINGTGLDNYKEDNKVDNYKIDSFIRIGAYKKSFDSVLNSISATAGKLEAKLNKDQITSYGSTDIVFEKSKQSSEYGGVTIPITISNIYLSKMNISRELNIDKINMYPNIGKIGDRVYIEGTNIDKAYDVHFLKIDGSDTYTEENKAIKEGNFFEENINNATDEKEKINRLTVKVPSTIAAGERYEVMMVQKSSNDVIGEKAIGEFTVVQESNKAVINQVYPGKGNDLGGYTRTVIGKNLITLNIPGLDVSYNPDDLEIDPPTEDKVDKLTLDYMPKGSYQPQYKDASTGSVYDVSNLQRNISVIVGSQAKFKKENDPVSGEDKYLISQGSQDSFNIELPRVTIDKDTTVDVKATIETTFEANGKTYKFIEIVELPDGYTYEMSSKTPTVKDVSPSKIQVKEGTNAYDFRNDTLISITGSDFVVTRIKDETANKSILMYPQVLIKSNNNLNREDFDIKVYIDPVDGKAKVQYKTVDKDGNLVVKTLDKYEDGSDIAFVVLNDKNQVVSGLDGDEVGDRIVMTIPKEAQIKSIGFKNLQIVNPIKNSTEYGNSALVPGAIEFLTTDDDISIDSVTPSVTSVDGGETIKVKGSGFEEGCKVYIDGIEVKNVSRDIDATGNKIILTFTAPAGREGETKLQVLNPSGSMATADFTYVKSFKKDPKLDDIVPKKGTKGNYVLVTGDNFLKTDPAINDVSGIGIYKLIGTRILMDGKDINKYNGPNNTPTIKDYETSEPILKMDSDKLKLSDYYNSVVLKDDDGRFYYFDKDPKSNIILLGSPEGTNIENKYVFSIKDGKIIGTKNGEDYEFVPSTKGFALNGATKTVNFTMQTVYAVEGDKITGNNTKVLNKGEILFKVPDLEKEGKGAGLYDVTVKNPDTKTATKEKGFEYIKNPQSNPTIDSIDPSKGSIDGGYLVTIKGTDFDSTSKVYIGGQLVDKKDTKVIDSQTIEIIVPKYSGDLNAFETDRMTVPIIVINDDGGSACVEEGFTYVNPDSKPQLKEIDPTSGSSAGYEIVTLNVYDFRPLDNADGTENDLMDIDSWATKKKLDKPVSNYTEYYESDKLPRVMFGNEEAKIVQVLSKEKIRVVTPKHTPSDVDVCFINPDSAISNKVKYKYVASTPKIDKIVPAFGRKTGNEKISIYGTGFEESFIDVYNETTKKADSVNQVLVRFGDMTNTNLDKKDPNYGRIDNMVATVKLDGGLTVDYNGENKRLDIKITENGKTYTGSVENFDGNTLYIPVSILDGYTGNELIKVQVQDNERLIVERGYSTQTNLIVQGEGADRKCEIETRTPSYYTVGKVSVTVINPDYGEAKGEFEYKNPDSNPQITNVLKENEERFKEEKLNGEDIKVVEFNYKGGNNISILGSDFRENLTVSIGDAVTIPYDQIIQPMSSNKITFKMPAVSEDQVGKLHKVFVTNEDGGSASSADDSLSKPIYVRFIKGESDNMSIEKVVPDRGTSKGGTKVEIIGNGFRKTMEGFENELLQVYFGNGSDIVKVPSENIEYVSNEKIVLTTPAHEPGIVSVKVINPDGTVVVLENAYTYTSSPTITSIVSPTDEGKRINEISVDGGEEIKIKGTDFMQGSKAIFVPVLEKVADDVTGDNIITIKGVRYKIVSGYETTDVNFIDSQNIIVKTPAGKLNEKGVIIVNPDGAATPIYENIKYVISKIVPPTGVNADLMYDKYININWDAVKGANEYEVYVVVNDRETELIGTTKNTSFVYEDLDKNTKYRFVVKALGDTGLSIASQESNSVRTDGSVGPDDKDGGLNEDTTQINSNNTAIVTVGYKDLRDGDVVIDLTSGVLAGCKEAVITMPAKAINEGRNNIIVKGIDFNAKFNPNAFNVGPMYENRDNDYAGVKFKINLNEQKDVNSLSNEYLLTAKYFVGKDSADVDLLKSNIDFTLDYDANKANFRKLENVALYRFDSYSSTWSYIAPRMDAYSTFVNAKVDRLGRYSVIGYRR